MQCELSSFTNSSVIAEDIREIFSDQDNTVSVPAHELHQIRMWLKGSDRWAKIISTNLSYPHC